MTPFFVFLDENMPVVQDKSFGGLISSQNCQVEIIPFPSRWRGKGVPDCEVVIWTRKAIFSGWHKIGESFSKGEDPIFIFFTTDLDFLEDAWSGMVSKEGSKKEKFDGVCFSPKSYTVCFFEDDREVIVRICRIHQKNGRRKGVLINHMIQAVRDILISPELS